MALTVLSDVILPNSVIEAGVRGKQMRRNSRVMVDSGAVAANIVWTQTLRQYEIGIAPMRRESWQAIEALHEVTEGGAYGFLMEDPKDMAATITQGAVTGITSTTFQLYKRYTDTSSARSKDRKITRPRATGFSVEIAGVPTGAYTLDTATGILTIASAPSASTVRWSGKFHVPVHFIDDTIDWEMAVAGPSVDARFLAGPNVLLQEVRE